MEIIDLKTAAHLLPEIAHWHHEQWAYLNPGRTLAQRIDDMQRHLDTTLVPSTWVAIDNKQRALGSASLLHADMDSHPELAPWLASVFVVPAFRRRGIAAELVRRVMQEARRGEIKTLYLFTPDQERLYASLGWQLLAREPYHGSDVTLMKTEL
jgi:N-acetylglutamate synthase-like GNAT family acetyltransferase